MRRIVLVVDDALLCSATLEVALASVPDLVVVSASRVEEALAFLSGADGHRVVALVTDLNMPGLDGFELIRRVRSKQRRLPVVVISGDPNPRTPTRVTQLGANAFFSKPFSPSEVRTTLEKLIDASSS